MTADEATARCLARGGTTLDECRAIVASRMVGGAYCADAIVIDEHGRRCVSDARKAAALAAERAADPEGLTALERARKDARAAQAAAAGSSGPSSGVVVAAVAIVALVALAAWRARD